MFKPIQWGKKEGKLSFICPFPSIVYFWLAVISKENQSWVF